MSEDAQEARNKDVKNYRENFSRKFSRTATMEDVFHRLLVTSDPFISSLSKIYPQQKKSLSTEALKLLSCENVIVNDCISEDDSESAEESD